MIYSNIDLGKLFIPPLVFFVSMLVLFLARKTLFRVINKWTTKVDSGYIDILMNVIRQPSIYLIIAFSLYVTVLFSELSARYVTYMDKAILIILILSITTLTSDFVGRIFKQHIQTLSSIVPTTALFHGIIKGMIMTTGFIIMLASLGISIAPFLTALGVGGLAVALALQDTLSNLFSGIHILIEKTIRVGDYIKLESGQEGYVDDITWRTTRIRMLANNIIIIPNSTLSKSIVTNYYLPDKPMSLLIPISVSYDSDPQRVEDVIVEEAIRATVDVPGLMSEPEPFLRFIPGFGDNSIDFTLICRVAEFVDQYIVQHQLRKRIFCRLRAEGIEIPFPQRTLHIRQEDKTTVTKNI
ncbi:transporter, small conductance mechanosensitive ion channel MscS family protein [Candidatus Magnetobacterium bavaricum]|uniref:Transporter, small conductance mechanosensitive ion channel MscS family protein n=1 Tax=Candidatus Magnetobacterium bavaricum TaxID=29290 RepID=A0A0F3GSB1_9BACT|nr:transporter, small conductance mechanosensitive ion channel MscS family protein [Candidatus Magnetobacterium bavaricum]